MLNAKVWLAPALLGVMLAGCGGSDSDDDDSTGDPVGEAESFHYVEGTIAQARPHHLRQVERRLPPQAI